jgi:hypothetical protein
MHSRTVALMLSATDPHSTNDLQQDSSPASVGSREASNTWDAICSVSASIHFLRTYFLACGRSLLSP